MILGVMQTVIPYNAETVQLEKDDLLVFFTDGITEAMDPDYKEYTDERLEQLALKLTDRSAPEVMEKIMEDVKLYIRGAEQSDDITLIIIKVI
jgi:sigma-B regulation protein RsbU (phosphoserine phosphatase)